MPEEVKRFEESLVWAMFCAFATRIGSSLPSLIVTCKRKNVPLTGDSPVTRLRLSAWKVAGIFLLDGTAHYPMKLQGWMIAVLLVLTLNICLGLLTFLFSLFVGLFEAAVILVWNDYVETSVLLPCLR